MTKFEEKGVDRQYSAGSIREAKSAFEKSCEICATQGRFVNCDKCADEQIYLGGGFYIE